MLVLDLADDLLDDVLDRDEAVGAAIFVDHQRQMDARRLHAREQVDRRHRRRHEQDLAHDLGRRQRHRQIDGLEIEAGGERLLALGVLVRVDRGARGHEGDQVADVHHADRIVERVVVDHQARMAGALEHLHQFAERDVLLHGDDVGARHHDVPDPALAQPRMFLSMRLSSGEKPDSPGGIGVEHVLEVGADRARLPAEQRAQRAREPAVAVFARGARPAPADCAARKAAVGLAWSLSGMAVRQSLDDRARR